MRKSFLLSLVCLLSCQFVAAKTKGPPRASIKATAQSNARGMTGTYDNRRGQFSVQHLGGNKLRVHFEGSYYYTVNGETTANTGIADGTATVRGNVATFVPQDGSACSISMRFVGRKLFVKQTGSDADCGFGHNVTATGTYRKISSRPPRIDH